MGDRKPTAKELGSALPPILGEVAAKSEEKYSTGVPRAAPFIFLGSSAIAQVKYNYEHFITTSGKWARLLTQAWVGPSLKLAGGAIAVADAVKKGDDVRQAFGSEMGDAALIARAGFHTLNTFLLPALVFSVAARGTRFLRSAGPHMEFIGKGSLAPNIAGLAATAGYIQMSDKYFEDAENLAALSIAAGFHNEIISVKTNANPKYDWWRPDPKLYGFDPELSSFMLLEAAPRRTMNLEAVRSEVLSVPDVYALRRGDLPRQELIHRRRGASVGFDELALTTTGEFYTDALLGLDNVPDVSTPEAFKKAVAEAVAVAGAARFGEGLAEYGVQNRRAGWPRGTPPPLSMRENALILGIVARSGQNKILAQAESGGLISIDELAALANTKEEEEAVEKLVLAETSIAFGEASALQNSLAAGARKGASPEALVSLAERACANSKMGWTVNSILKVALNPDGVPETPAEEKKLAEANPADLIRDEYKNLVAHQSVLPPAALLGYNSVFAKRLIKQARIPGSFSEEADVAVRQLARKMAADFSKPVDLAAFKNTYDAVLLAEADKGVSRKPAPDALLSFDVASTLFNTSEEEYAARLAKVKGIMTRARKTGTELDIAAAQNLRPFDDLLFQSTLSGLARLRDE